MKILRWILAFLCIGYFALTLAPVLHKYFFVSMSPVTPINVTQETILAYNTRLDLSKTLFQSNLILMGLIWGLVLAKKGDIQITKDDWPEVIMFILANLVLASSYYAHIVFVCEMSHNMLFSSITNNKIPDMDHPDVAYSLVSQYITLIGGAIIVALVIVSTAWFKKSKVKERRYVKGNIMCHVMRCVR
jgi:hypothetical protein